MDVGLVDGDLPVFCRFIEGDDLTLQRLRLRILQMRGTWIPDRAAGIPYLEWSQTKPVPLDAIRVLVRAEMEADPVVIVDTFAAGFNQNTQEIRCRGYFHLASGRRGEFLLSGSADSINSTPWTTVDVGFVSPS